MPKLMSETTRKQLHREHAYVRHIASSKHGLDMEQRPFITSLVIDLIRSQAAPYRYYVFMAVNQPDMHVEPI